MREGAQRAMILVMHSHLQFPHPTALLRQKNARMGLDDLKSLMVAVQVWLWLFPRIQVLLPLTFRLR